MAAPARGRRKQGRSVNGLTFRDMVESHARVYGDSGGLAEVVRFITSTIDEDGLRSHAEGLRAALTYPPYRQEVAPLLREWFGYEIVATADGARVRDRSGAEIGVASAHAATQADPERQATLYRVAMTL